MARKKIGRNGVDWSAAGFKSWVTRRRNMAARRRAALKGAKTRAAKKVAA